jgi:hypothetical protein
MRLEYLIIKIRPILVKIQHFLQSSFGHSFTLVSLFVVKIVIIPQPLVKFTPLDRMPNSDDVDAIQTFELPNPEDIGREMAFLVGIIVKQYRKFSFPSTQHAWKGF